MFLGVFFFMGYMVGHMKILLDCSVAWTQGRDLRMVKLDQEREQEQEVLQAGQPEQLAHSKDGRSAGAAPAAFFVHGRFEK